MPFPARASKAPAVLCILLCVCIYSGTRVKLALLCKHVKKVVTKIRLVHRHWDGNRDDFCVKISYLVFSYDCCFTCLYPAKWGSTACDYS